MIVRHGGKYFVFEHPPWLGACASWGWAAVAAGFPFPRCVKLILTRNGKSPESIYNIYITLLPS
jgi:hypothetical protein